MLCRSSAKEENHKQPGDKSNAEGLGSASIAGGFWTSKDIMKGATAALASAADDQESGENYEPSHAEEFAASCGYVLSIVKRD